MMELKSVVVLFLFCVVPVLSRELKKLTKDDPHACERSLDDVKPVRVTSRCSKARNKICSHIERRKVTIKDYICCEGWTFVDGICVPMKCAPPCHNARCTDTNVCTCEPGLVHLNETLCGPACPPDQFNDLTDPAFPCKPKCSQTCINGACVDFETCSCNAGYKRKDEFNCEPKCSTCEHGTCGAPDECNCSTGYKKNDEGKCEPVCEDCEHGSCVAPNDCECEGGYRKESNKCIPVCDETCQNGHCTAPNECTCDRQYSKDATNKFKCNPICDHACVNSTCVAPDICQCNDGFETAGNNWTCRPSCKSCSYGECIAPNKCICNEGYEKSDEDICIPVCKSCDNGACVAPNKCVCNDGYKKNDTNICVPVCKTPCTDGVCVKPDTCVCNEGYKMNDISKLCKPECHPSCINSTCVAVNECKCFYGYMKTNVSNVCKPACTSCFNGDCVEPEVCQCHDGYELVNGTCLPAPSMNCLDCDGVCKDGVCACSNGTLGHQIESADVELTPTLAGLQLTWMLGGAVGLLLLVVVAVVLLRMWRLRQSYDQKAPDNNYEAYGSVAYTINNTLMHREPQDPLYDDVELDRQTDVGLLAEHIPTEDYVERI
ncbi:hypothetical protein ABMA28_000708 [Loxostege sticticalis]|uniref:EGF-like domain-containing protein n=1 Tax=Loxostege sticticalis TaxID=481309 RepID=A0ABD0T5Y6_LOXSC